MVYILINLIFWKCYRAEDIKRWGIQRFLDTVCAKEPIPMPDFRFTEAENKLMDEILLEEKMSHDL